MSLEESEWLIDGFGLGKYEEDSEWLVDGHELGIKTGVVLRFIDTYIVGAVLIDNLKPRGSEFSRFAFFVTAWARNFFVGSYLTLRRRACALLSLAFGHSVSSLELDTMHINTIAVTERERCLRAEIATQNFLMSTGLCWIIG